MQWSDLSIIPVKMEDTLIETQDLIQKINLGTSEELRIIYINVLLLDDLKLKLKEFKDYVAWDYDEMPGLSQRLVEY